MEEIKNQTKIDGLNKKKAEKDDGRIIIYYSRTENEEGD